MATQLVVSPAHSGARRTITRLSRRAEPLVSRPLVHRAF